MPGTFSPPPRVSDPDMQYDTVTWVTHVPWCMPGSLTSGSSEVSGGKTFSAHELDVHGWQRESPVQDNLVCLILREGIVSIQKCHLTVNTLRPRQNGRHFPDDIFKWIFLNENVWILINISLKIVPRGSINNIPTLVQIMAWRRPGDKPLSEPMMVRLPTQICVTRPQWVNVA